MSLREVFPIAVTLAAVCLFVTLGLWQLDRASQKQVMYDGYLDNRDKRVLSLNVLSEDFGFDQQMGRKVEARVVFLERYLILDNQSRQGRPGYLILAVFAVDGAASAVVVNAGWVAASGRRDQLPALPAAKDVPRLIQGRLAAPPSVGLQFRKAAAWEALGPGVQRVQLVDFERIADWLGVPVLPVLIELDPDEPWGASKDWRIPGSGAERHRAYAVQWFSFAAIAIVLWFFLGHKNRGRDEV